MNLKIIYIIFNIILYISINIYYLTYYKKKLFVEKFVLSKNFKIKLISSKLY